MPRCFFLFLAFVLAPFVVTTPQAAHAQSADATSAPVRRGWIYFGGGLGTVRGIEPDAAAGILTVNYQRGPHLISVRHTLVFDVFGDGGNDLGLLYGRALSWPWGHASLSAGVAYTWTEKTRAVAGGENIELDSETIGLPLQVQVYVAPFPNIVPIGIGIGGFANLNHEHSFAGATFGVVIGDLR